MDTITAQYHARLKAMGMDDQGMLTLAPPCRGCGRPLNEDGGHPAEKYAGSYTGLCYGCQKKGPFITDTLVSGARVWSCPPHCPEWRRDREVFFQFEGCDCDHGREWRTERGVWVTNRYPAQCSKCSGKHYKNPVVRAQAEADAKVWKAIQSWEHRISEETRYRMKQRCIPDTDMVGMRRVFDEVIKEAPPKPAEGIPVTWPKHWKGGPCCT